MADSSNAKQQQRPSGIAAAAIEGAKEGERAEHANPDDNTGKLARPAPGMADQPAASPSSTNQYTGVTGAIREDQEDEEQEWRRAGGAGGSPDDEPRER